MNKHVLSSAKPSLANRVISMLPVRGKRILFGVVLFQMCISGKCSTAQLSELNRELTLAGKVEALVFPSLWAVPFWGSDTTLVDRIKSLNSNDIESMGEADWARLMEGVPSWLSYATNDKMISDVKRLVRVIERVGK